jgi:uncharacterized membrane protein
MKTFGGTAARQLAAVFFLLGLVAVALLAVNIPPFQSADEPAHFLRAAQLADGGVVGTRYFSVEPDGRRRALQGGMVDPAILTATMPFMSLAFHPEIRATRTQWASNVHWSGQRVMGSFQTSSYSPVFYVPSAIGILIGRTADMTIVQTLMLSRILTGTAAVALTAIAISFAGGAAPWLFAIMALPMSLSLMASSSQDGLLFACSALAGALMVRVIRSPGAQNGMVLACLGLCLGLMGMARPAYGALAAAPLGLTKVQWRWRIMAAAIAGGCTALWSALVAVGVMTNVGDFLGVDPQAQWELIYHDPMRAWNVLSDTLRLYWPVYLMTFIGQLGWADTVLPAAYHTAVHFMLGAAALATMLGSGREPVIAAHRLITTFCLVLSVVGIFGLVYLTWTVPGNPTVVGVQGRYFTPLALACVTLLPGISRPDWTWTRTVMWTHKVLLMFIGMFPIITLAVTMRAIVLRYYLG